MYSPDNAVATEKWAGGILEIWDGYIPNIKPAVLRNPSICCVVTGMRSGAKVIYGYSNMVSDLEAVFGNTVHENAPIEVILDFPTVLDANRFIYAASNLIMGAVSVLKGLDIHLYFGHYALEHMLVSQASISIHPGTLGATAQISMVGYDYAYAKDENAGNIEIERSSVEDMSAPPVENGKCSISTKPGGYGYSAVLVEEAYLTAIDITWQENIKIIGRNKEYTVYPRYPTVISIGVVVTRNPELQGSSSTMNENYNRTLPEHRIQRVFDLIKRTIDSEESIVISTILYGDITMLPTSVSTDRGKTQQGDMGITGIIMSQSNPLSMGRAKGQIENIIYRNEADGDSA